MNNILCFSSVTHNKLYNEIESNILRYKDTGFKELLSSNQSTITIGIKSDLSPLEDLICNNDIESEVENSLLVWRALQNIPASLATENRFWSFLTHIHCFEYTRKRWPQTIDEELTTAVKQIKKHFFALGTGGYRDDNSVSRLWWNAYIAKKLRPMNIKSALELIVKKADIRSGLIERPLSFYRPNLSKAILAKLDKDELISSKEINFREFMKQINLFGGGVLFECMDSVQCNIFVDNCWNQALHNLNNK
jgi:hypothetical protein